MKIRDIEAFQVSWTPGDKPEQRSAWVRIYCDDGSFGIGEASPMQGGLASLGMIVHNLAPALIGNDPLDHAVLLDTLLFAGRAMRLIREIAEIYGQRPGLAGTVHLLRRLASGAGLVGAVDVVGGVIVQQLGGAVLERLSASAAESAYAAQKMARLGLIAMASCRPIEFRPGEAPSLSGLVSGLLKKNQKLDQ